MSKELRKSDLLTTKVEHVSLDTFNPVPLVEAMAKMAFQARNTARAAEIYQMMLRDKDCAVVLCLAGSLISAGLRKVIAQMVQADMVDAIVSTGANIVDQDFFEALGFAHWQGTQFIDDNVLRDLHIDRIYDTFIDEDELRICDDTIGKLCDALEPRPYSSREFIREMGRWLVQQKQGQDSIVRIAHEKGVPIFCPAFSDCSAGFGFVAHIAARQARGEAVVACDSAKDFYELTQIKIKNPTTGLLMIGGGVPKNFAQDIVVAAEILGIDAPMHKYAIQVTVADVRDGALSGSTLKEASSWGKVDTVWEQMVYSEATLALPLIAAYGYHRGNWKKREAKKFAQLLDAAPAVA